MENLPKQQEESPLEKFRDKIRSLKEDEELNSKAAHFQYINPQELDENDFELYEIVSKEKVPYEEAVMMVQARAEELRDSDHISQIRFRDYLANLLTIWLEKLM